MADSRSNSNTGQRRARDEGNAGVESVAPTSHFKRTLVPLEEYAAKQGVPSEIVEQQGQLGVIQIRKFKGQMYVVDVPIAEEAEAEAEETLEQARAAVKMQPQKSSKLITAALTALAIVVVVTVFWLYMDARTRLDDLSSEYTVLQNRYQQLGGASIGAGTTQGQLAGSKEELANIRNRIAASKAELEKIETDFSAARRSLDAIQSDLTAVQGQISLSRVEIEGVQNVLKTGRKNLDVLERQTAEPPPKQ